MAKKPEHKRKRVILMADGHSGHEFGLTPPDWQYRPVPGASSSLIRRQNKCALFQGEMWNWFSAEVKTLQPIDILIYDGDCIDGPGNKTGGAEQIHTDMTKQIEMAVETIRLVGSNKILMTYGTKYHVSSVDGSMDCEDVIAKEVGAAKIGSHEWLTVNGVTFDVKHKIGRSTIPHGRGTPLARAWLWSALWSEIAMAPKSDVIVRAHCHYPFLIGDPLVPYLAISLPALQWSTRYGARDCEGLVGCGFVHFDIEPNGEYQYKFHVAKLPNQKTEALQW